MVQMMMGCGRCTVSPNLRLFILVIGVLLYLTFGALVFSTLEEEFEEEHVTRLRAMRTGFSSKLQSGNVTDAELEEFIAAVVAASQAGILATNNVTFVSSWSFGQSFFFVGTLVTTIGYGHTRPLSYNGKIFAIFYSLFGVPLTVLMFSAIVSRLVKLLGYFLNWLKSKMINNKELHAKLLHLAIITLMLVIFIFLLPAAIFVALETEWNYLDGIYYCFISLTTIGLGDYIPGEDKAQPYRAVYKMATTIYLFIGLICLMTTITVVRNIKEFDISKHFFVSEEEDVDFEKEHLTPNNSEEIQNYSTESGMPTDGGTSTSVY